MRIGEVARRTGFTTSSIRYYESVGVLPEPERVGGRRDYGEEVVRRLTAIAAAQRAGFSLAEIGLLLGADGDEGTGRRLQDMATRKLEDIEALIRDAEAMREWLLAARGCECPTLEVCPLFEIAPA